MMYKITTRIFIFFLGSISFNLGWSQEDLDALLNELDPLPPQEVIATFKSGKIINLHDVFHGVATEMSVIAKNAIIFKDVPETFLAARYHSWAATDEGFPEEIQVTARDEDGLIQAIEHKMFPISAVQFHPESILTEVGEQIVRNFIEANS